MIPVPCGSGQRLVIGLVNNMGRRAMRSSERQFGDLLRSASPDLEIELKLFTLDDEDDGPTGQARHAGYRGLDALEDAGIDALIVTGMEPTQQRLQDEPNWGALTRLIDWTELNRIPAVWSCLVAHAAVLYLTGIDRRPLPTKLSGVFQCHRTSARHPLTAGMPPRWQSPHSRHNGLSETDLVAGGYEILSRSEEVGPDVFTRIDGPATLFLQGHPEYDPTTLLREYIRDVRRYVSGENPRHPAIPTSYLDTTSEWRFAELRAVALGGNGDIMVPLLAAARDAQPLDVDRSMGARLYANWLGQIAQRHVDMPSSVREPAHAR